jgi:hypothetical protein
VSLQVSIQRAIETIRWRGPWRTASLIARDTLRPILDWQVFKIAETDVESEARRAEGATGAFPVQMFRREDGAERVTRELAPILAFEPTDVAARLRDGDQVAVAYDGQKAIGCTWAALRRPVSMPMNTVWSIQPGEAVLYHSFVLPEWRGKRVHRSLDLALNVAMRERGIRRTLGSMSVLNPQTLSLAKRNGKQFVMTLYLVRVPLLDWTGRFATGRPLHMHFEPVTTGAALPAVEPAGTVK